MELIVLTYEELQAKNAELIHLVKELLLRISELEKQLGKNSGNSSKPPSTDVFKKKVQNNREKGTNKSGGQPGHKGHHLTLVDTSLVSELSYLPVLGSCDCGASLSESGEILGYERRQVWDIPELHPFIKEYQLEQKRCNCGKLHKSSCGYGYSIQYGSRIRALSCYLQNEQLLPIERTQSVLSDIFGFSQVSEGLILDSSWVCYQGLSDWEEQQKKALQDSEVLHVDETGFRVNGKRAWGHVCATDKLTLYQYSPKRGKEAHEVHDILPFFSGLMVHDRYSSYNNYDCQHSFCNAHLLRELKSLIEDGQIWAIKMYALVNETYKGFHCAISLETHYQAIIAQGLLDNPIPKRINPKGKIKKTASLNLLECFRDHKTEIFRFFHQENAPFDNNLAERDLRMFKLKEKISTSFRTEKGAKIFCRVRSYISTLKKQGKTVWEYLCLFFDNKCIQITYN